MELTFEVNRYNPEKPEGSFYQEFNLNLEPEDLDDTTVLDTLIRLKENKDGSLTFRHSCGHGSCGSCAMLINGENRLACKTHLVDIVSDEDSAVKISPIPGFPVIRDLVVDLGSLFEHDREIKPFLIGEASQSGERESLQTPDELDKIEQFTECIMCGACTSSCPTYWDNKKYLGPAAFVRAFRWERDSRDRGEGERLEALDDKRGGVWGCNKVFNCNEACPKDIDTVGAIEKLKRKALGF